jgi:hypothetical protein
VPTESALDVLGEFHELIILKNDEKSCDGAISPIYSMFAKNKIDHKMEN